MLPLRKSAHIPQSIAGLVVEYIVLSLLLRCLCGFRACVVVAVRLPLLPLAPLCHALFLLGLVADWVPCRAAGK